MGGKHDLLEKREAVRVIREIPLYQVEWRVEAHVEWRVEAHVRLGNNVTARLFALVI